LRPWSRFRWRSASSGWFAATRSSAACRWSRRWQHVRHLLGQDRHADQGRDDGPPRLRGSQWLDLSGAGYEPAGQFTSKGRPWSLRRLCNNCCKRRRWPRTRIWCTTKPRALADQGRSDRRRSDRRRRQGGLHKLELDDRYPALTKSLYVRNQTHDDAARGFRRRGGVRQGRPEIILATCTRQLTRMARSRWTNPAANSSCTWPVPWPARRCGCWRGPESECVPRNGRAGHDVPGPGGNDRPAPPEAKAAIHTCEWPASNP